MQSILQEWLEISPLALASLIALGASVLLWVIARGVLFYLGRLISRTHFRIDTLLISCLQRPITLLSIAGGLVVFRMLMSSEDLLDDATNGVLLVGIQLLMVLSIWAFADRFTAGTLNIFSEQHPVVRDSRSLLQGIIRGIIILLAVLIILGTLGISITPFLASLGITSLAVALALQPTLENFFSGLQLVMDKPIRVGDYIELDSGEQGFVEKIGWRSTWIRMLPNNTVIMPNREMANSKIINYFYPEKELSVPVEVGVHYDSDLEHVERVTLEVAREILVSHEWGVDDYNTFVVYTAFDSSSINFTVMLRAKEYFNRFWVKSAFMKALHKRYKEEGIVIPYPIRALNTSQESARFMHQEAHGEAED